MFGPHRYRSPLLDIFGIVHLKPSVSDEPTPFAFVRGSYPFPTTEVISSSKNSNFTLGSDIQRLAHQARLAYRQHAVLGREGCIYSVADVRQFILFVSLWSKAATRNGCGKLATRAARGQGRLRAAKRLSFPYGANYPRTTFDSHSHSHSYRSMTTVDDSFELYDLRVEVIIPPGAQIMCGAKEGDHFTLQGEMLHLPPGQGFSLYSLGENLVITHLIFSAKD